MSGNTTNQGYPYPLPSDFSDVQDAYRLATAIDTDLRAAQAPLRAFMGRPSFIGRSTVNGSAITNGNDYLNVGAIEWDNTGGLAVGSISWVQPVAQAPSWWLFGADIVVTESGTPTIGDMVLSELTVSSVDQVTGVSSSTVFWQRQDDSNTNGEWINLYGMAAVYRGNINVQLNVNGATAKYINLGSRMWGMYLGPVT